MKAWSECNKAYLSLFTLLFIVYGVAISQLERDNFSYINKNRGVWGLPPFVLSALSGEFKGIVSNMLLLDAGARTGTKLERNIDGGYLVAQIDSEYNCETIHEILTAGQFLDPNFQQTYMVAQGWLPWDCNMVEETISILQTAKKHRPADLFPVSFMSFNYYYFLNDHAKAGKILLQAAESMENPPSYLAILGSRLIKKGGQTEAGIVMLKSILANMASGEPGYDDVNQRLQSLQAVLILEKAVKKYQVKFGKLPVQPEDLLSEDILLSLPQNPYNLSFCINQKGMIFFDRPDCRNAHSTP